MPRQRAATRQRLEALVAAKEAKHPKEGGDEDADQSAPDYDPKSQGARPEYGFDPAEWTPSVVEGRRHRRLSDKFSPSESPKRRRKTGRKRKKGRTLPSDTDSSSENAEEEEPPVKRLRARAATHVSPDTWLQVQTDACLAVKVAEIMASERGGSKKGGGRSQLMQDLSEETRVSRTTLYRIHARALNQELCRRYFLPERDILTEPTLERPAKPAQERVQDFVHARLAELKGEITLRDLQDELEDNGVETSYSTLQRVTRRLGWKKGKRRFRPILTDAIKRARFVWARHWLDYDIKDRWGGLGTVISFTDEKWFFIGCGDTAFNNPNVDTSVPVPSKSKTQKLKVMCMTLVGRPCVENRFDGRIGNKFVVKEVVQQKASKYGPAGSIRTEPATLDRNSSVDLLMKMIEEALDGTFYAIGRNGQPYCWCRRWVIIMDSAGGHGGGRATTRDDKGMNQTKKMLDERVAKLLAERRGRGLPCPNTIEFQVQPTRSPDMNVLDLGLWCAFEVKARKIQRRVRMEMAVARREAEAAAAAAAQVSTSDESSGDEERCKCGAGSQCKRRCPCQQADRDCTHACGCSHARCSRRDPEEPAEERPPALKRGIQELMDAVTEAWTKLSAAKIESCYQTLDQVLQIAVDTEGDNTNTNFHRTAENYDADRIRKVREQWPEERVELPMSEETAKLIPIASEISDELLESFSETDDAPSSETEVTPCSDTSTGSTSVRSSAEETDPGSEFADSEEVEAALQDSRFFTGALFPFASSFATHLWSRSQ